MKISVTAGGRPDRGPTAALFDDYAQRIRRMGVALDVGFVPDVASGGRYSDAHVRERESRALREAVPTRSHLIALSPSGTTVTTEAFAKRLESWTHPLAAFVIGGPLGLDPAFIESADACVSLSPMTLPHELARVVLAEQIYRALTLLRGVPYHK